MPRGRRASTGNSGKFWKRMSSCSGVALSSARMLWMKALCGSRPTKVADRLAAQVLELLDVGVGPDQQEERLRAFAGVDDLQRHVVGDAGNHRRVADEGEGHRIAAGAQQLHHRTGVRKVAPVDGDVIAERGGLALEQPRFHHVTGDRNPGRRQGLPADDQRAPAALARGLLRTGRKRHARQRRRGQARDA
jgi:hypothetical protein